jgi:hypothetical protein
MEYKLQIHSIGRTGRAQRLGKKGHFGKVSQQGKRVPPKFVEAKFTCETYRFFLFN